MGVIGGDSLRVMYEGKAVQIRLFRPIDCPEKRQAFGTRANEYTSELAFGRDAAVGGRRDRYGRRLTEVLLPDGRSLNQELINAGLAWWFRKYSKDFRLGGAGTAGTGSEAWLWVELLTQSRRGSGDSMPPAQSGKPSDSRASSCRQTCVQSLAFPAPCFNLSVRHTQASHVPAP